MLTWLDLTASDRDRMQQVLDLYKEQGTVDEMGFGRLRDAPSETLFPGTSAGGPGKRGCQFGWRARMMPGSSPGSSAAGPCRRPVKWTWYQP